jgi:hypothetical protein
MQMAQVTFGLLTTACKNTSVCAEVGHGLWVDLVGKQNNWKRTPQRNLELEV